MWFAVTPDIGVWCLATAGVEDGRICHKTRGSRQFSQSQLLEKSVVFGFEVLDAIGGGLDVGVGLLQIDFGFGDCGADVALNRSS